jgi:hypothetical protein
VAGTKLSEDACYVTHAPMKFAFHFVDLIQALTVALEAKHA